MIRGLTMKTISQHQLAKIHFGDISAPSISWKKANKIAKRARKFYTKIRRVK